jgi:hypothetical protein
VVTDPPEETEMDVDAGAGGGEGSEASTDGGADPSVLPDSGGGGASSLPDASDAAPPPEPRTRESLVDHDEWQIVPDADDPYLDERPETVTCDADNGYGAEAFQPGDPPDSSLFVSTVYCDYLTVEQPTLVPIVAGDTVVLRLWQSALLIPQGATVHIAVRVGDEIAWEDTVPIPIDSAMLKEEWQVVTDVPTGTPVQFHLHNHGSNEYSLLELSVGP